MNISEPLGESGWGPFIARIALGSWLVLVGLENVERLPQYIEQIRLAGKIPEPFTQLYATLVPYLEVAAGALLIVGMWTTLAGIIAGLILGSLLYISGVFPQGSNLFSKDVILLAVALSLLYTGSGNLSIDKFRKGG